MSNSLVELEKDVEYWTGQTAKDLRQGTIEETRRSLSLKGIVMKIISAFPFIGRGNVMKDRILGHEKVNKMLDKAIR